VANIVGQALRAKVELRDPDGTVQNAAEAPLGAANLSQAVGVWDGYVYVYDNDVPILSDVRRVKVSRGKTALVSVEILEGSAGSRPLHAFDQDHDMALDSVEVAMGTRPDSAASVPGMETLDWASPVLKEGAGWYVGDLHAHSSYGIGSESIAELVRRAERSGLDFLSITDRNSLESVRDSDYRSDKVVLVPGMEWGTDEKGVALIYGPRTFPGPANSYAEAQATSLRVQAQGGIFVVAHPCYPNMPWQWGVQHVNAVEAWCRDWRDVPPLFPQMLDDKMRSRAPQLPDGRPGKPLYSIARAASTAGYSANGQAAIFWDMETARGLRASAIGGSYSMGPKVPLAEPATYVYASEKSAEGILAGLRLGRTFVSKGLDGPRVHFWADWMGDSWHEKSLVDSGIGGVVPLNVMTQFIVEVFGATGKRLEVLLNGLPIRSKIVEGDGAFTFVWTQSSFGVFRVRIVEPATDEGWGFVNMLAMTSPIYAYNVIPVSGAAGGDVWLNIESEHWSAEEKRDYLPSDPSRWELAPDWKL
jgi:hypothetical protein